MSADRNLLLGIVALQMDFISRDALIAAMNAWVLQKQTPLSQILLHHGAILPDVRTLVEALVEKHLEQHGHDTQKSLASLSSVPSIEPDLERIGDTDLHASLAGAAALRARRHGAVDSYPTRPPSVSASSSVIRFTILRPHKKGGLGQVSIACDEELNREVAFKEIQERYADDDVNRARFRLEAEVTGKLEHPGIVPVYGLGTFGDGRPFYAMRLIKGDSLHDAIKKFHAALRERPSNGELLVEFRKLLGRFIEVCNAVEYAHSRGVLHRDIKPENIMLGPFGETLVVDWGLAKVIGGAAQDAGVNEKMLPSSQAHATQMGKAVGTPEYMSPEQASGRLDALGPSSDVYGLGATLYSILTGQAPFLATEQGDVLARVEMGDFAPPCSVARNVPRALEAICLKAMALKPQDRYCSPLRLADDLEHWLADEPVTAMRESLLHRFGRWRRSHSPIVAAISVLTLVFAAWGGARYHDAQIAARFAALDIAYDSARSNLSPTPDAWRRLEDILGKMEKLDPDRSKRNESECVKVFAEQLEADVKKQPRLLQKDVARYKDCLELLRAHDSRRSDDIQAVLNGRLGEKKPLFDLTTPFAEEDLSQVIHNGVTIDPKGPALMRNSPDPIVATEYESKGAVEFAISLLPGKLPNEEIALALDFVPEKGALDSYHVTLSASGTREGNKNGRVRIMKGQDLLRERNVHVPNGRLTFSIKRVRGQLEAKLNDQLSLRFDAIFPLGGIDEQGVFAVKWPADLSVERLSAWSSAYETQSPLENGDRLFASGKYREALDAYSSQAALTTDKDNLQELRYKQARCHLELNSAEAEDLLEEVVAEEGSTWPPLAACELFVVRAQKHEWRGADAAFTRLAHVPEGSDTFSMIFDRVRSRVLPVFSLPEGFGVPRQAVLKKEFVAQVGKLIEKALEGADIAESEQLKTTLSLVAVYVASDIDRLDLFRRLVAQPDLPDKAIRFVVDSYTNLSVRTNRPGEALEVIGAFLERQRPPWLRASLLLQKARVLASMDEFDESQRVLDDFFLVTDGDQEHLFEELVDAWILKGFLSPESPDDTERIKIWKDGYALLKRPERMSYLGVAILASLSHDLEDEDAKAMITNVARANPGSFPYAEVLMRDNLYIPEVYDALRDMWYWERGRSYVRDMAFHRISYRTIKLVQVPLFVAEIIRKSFDEPLPPVVEELLWQTSYRVWLGFQEKRFDMFDATKLFLAWMGRRGPLGWSGISEKLERDFAGQRAVISLAIGCHRRKQGSLDDAIFFLNEAKSTALRVSPDDQDLRKLIDEEIKKTTAPEDQN